MLNFLPPLLFKHLTATLLLCTIGIATPSLASQNFLPPPESPSNLLPIGNKVYFSVSESQKMDNDLLIITLKASAQARSANVVMENINRKMQMAIASLKNYPNIDVQTSQYRIHPIYNKGETIRHWNGSQSLIIILDAQSEQLNVLTELQEHLVYQSMHFKISGQKKQHAIQQLTLTALKTFQQQAKLIANAFGSVRYQLLETRINSPLPRANPPSATFSNRMVMANSMTAPTIESGQSTITVNISGVLLLSQ